MPQYRYHAVDDQGIMENELCPVFVAGVRSRAVAPARSEVSDHAWIPVRHLGEVARTSPFLLSPWSAEQIRFLIDLQQPSESFSGLLGGRGAVPDH